MPNLAFLECPCWATKTGNLSREHSNKWKAFFNEYSIVLQCRGCGEKRAFQINHSFCPSCNEKYTSVERKRIPEMIIRKISRVDTERLKLGKSFNNQRYQIIAVGDRERMLLETKDPPNGVRVGQKTMIELRNPQKTITDAIETKKKDDK